MQFVTDVKPFEKMKLRLLNGSHSLMAYLGYLAGYETIAETIADPAFEAAVRARCARPKPHSTRYRVPTLRRTKRN